MGLNSFYGIMKSMTAQWLAQQVVNEGDTYNDNDILICGKCGEPRQEFREWPDPTDEEPNRTTLLKTTRMCKCERDERDEKERLKKKQEDMERIKFLKKASLMDAKFQNATFDKFQVTANNSKNLKFCRRYATAFDEMLEKCQGLLFWGGVGTGKSFAAACIANRLLENKVPVIMTSFVKILELIQKDRDEESKIISRLMNVKLVIFDDLGAERDTSYALEKVYNIIDSRYRSGLPMILTTNLTLQEMQEETDIQYARIYDRIFEVCYFRKGMAIYIEGSLRLRTWDDQQGNKRSALEVVADDIRFIDSKNDNANSGNNGGYVPESYGQTSPQFEEIGEDDDLPF